MYENDLRCILAEICEEEISELNKLPPFRPSLRHRYAMKRIFALWKKNALTAANAPAPDSTLRHTRLRFGKRLMIFLAVIVCAALLTGFIVVYFSKNFHGTVYNDNTQLFAVDTENCLTAIEYKYYLPELPEGFEIVEHSSLSFCVNTLYENEFSGQIIKLSQYTKNNYKPHYNTERYDFEQIVINGHNGLCLDFSNDERVDSIVVWDNDDYVLEISGNLNKSSLFELAKSAKVLEN